jgi:hypothetical protein
MYKVKAGKTTIWMDVLQSNESFLVYGLYVFLNYICRIFELHLIPLVLFIYQRWITVASHIKPVFRLNNPVFRNVFHNLSYHS